MAQHDPDPEDAEPSAPPEDDAQERQAPPSAAPFVSRRALGIALALVALIGVIAVEVRYIVGSAHNPTAAPSASLAKVASAARPQEESPSGVPAASAPPSPSAKEMFEDDNERSSSEPKKPKRDQRVVRGTVRDAAARSCSTSSVDGLSRQILAQARCIDPRAFMPVPRQPNLEIAPNVFLYLEASARDQLVRALQANRKNTMTVNSAFRTVAQQYLLRRWASSRRCGIEIASLPGESNHETGLALDIAEAAAWRSTLEAHDFRWLGSVDRVHFDFKGANISSRPSVDVKAFQQLWNLNHDDDQLVVNGQYASATEERLEKSPARGFPIGPRCRR